MREFYTIIAPPPQEQEAHAHPPQYFGSGGARAPCLLVCYAQWRRQTTKLGSAIKGQLYFRVGQMEGPKVPSEAPAL